MTRSLARVCPGRDCPAHDPVPWLRPGGRVGVVSCPAAPASGGQPCFARPGRGRRARHAIVRAENLIRGCDQQRCPTCRPTVMITGHVPAVHLPPDHPDALMAAAVPARGSMEDRRDLDPAPPARCPATAAAAPPEPGLGRPGTARDPARRDTESAAPGAAAAGHPGHGPALAPRHRPLPLGRQARARQDRQARHPPEHQGPGAPVSPREPRLGVPPDPRRAGRPGSEISSVRRYGKS